MRDKISVLYYPDASADQTTLKKAILFFDEIHFMDRPSFTFEGGMGSIGMQSPLRQFEHLFKRDGVPVWIHEPPSGRVWGDFLERIAADVNDPVFLAGFQDGLRTSDTFRLIHITPGKYPDIDTKEVVDERRLADLMIALDHKDILKGRGDAMALLTDQDTRPFSFSKPVSLLKTMIFNAAVCSAKMNLALDIGGSEGFVPFADAEPYGRLLGAKYARASGRLAGMGVAVPAGELAFAIFDGLTPPGLLEQMRFEDVIRYRHESEKDREAFLEYLDVLRRKASSPSKEGHAESIERLVRTEIIPAARTYENRLRTIAESFVGSLAKGVMGAGAAAGGVQLFSDLSLAKILLLAGAASAYVGQAAVDALVANRSATRECALSYILSLD